MKKNLICMLSVCTLLTSCASDGVLTSQPINPQTEGVSKSLGISVGIDTKAIKSGSAFVKDDQIGVFIVPVVSGTYVPAVNVYKWNETSWANTATTTSISLNNNKARVYAFYPSDLIPTMATINTNPSTVPVTVSASQTLATTTGVTNQVDYMWAASADTEGINNANANVALAFKHVLSRIMFIITKDASYTSVATITNLEISNGTGTAMFSAGTGTMSLAGVLALPTTLVNTLSFVPTGGIAASAAATTTPIISGLVAPCTALTSTGANILKINMTVNDKVMTANLPVGLITKWDAGLQYTYTLTIGGSGLIPTGVTISDWTGASVAAAVPFS